MFRFWVISMITMLFCANPAKAYDVDRGLRDLETFYNSAVRTIPPQDVDYGTADLALEFPEGPQRNFNIATRGFENTLVKLEAWLAAPPTSAVQAKVTKVRKLVDGWRGQMATKAYDPLILQNTLGCSLKGQTIPPACFNFILSNDDRNPNWNLVSVVAIRLRDKLTTEQKFELIKAAVKKGDLETIQYIFNMGNEYLGLKSAQVLEVFQGLCNFGQLQYLDPMNEEKNHSQTNEVLLHELTPGDFKTMRNGCRAKFNRPSPDAPGGIDPNLQAFDDLMILIEGQRDRRSNPKGLDDVRA
ncbi:MAG: hypothetical protein AAF203_07170 [Pseudomonadota bacterium]